MFIDKFIIRVDFNFYSEKDPKFLDPSPQLINISPKIHKFQKLSLISQVLNILKHLVNIWHSIRLKLGKDSFIFEINFKCSG